MRTAILLAALAATTLPAHAGGPARGVVELFTSQGCSSCPPADKAFSSIIDRGGYVTLSWHVDYWDHLGWKDTFSSASATRRQETYAARIGGGSYTPEFVVNGNRGSSKSSVVSGGGLPVSVSVNNGKVKIGAGSGRADVIVVRFTSSATVPISRGENAGRSVTYRHVARGASKLGVWNGAPKEFSTGGGSCAVLLQRPGQGEIIGAANC